MNPAEVFLHLDAPGIAVVRALAMDEAERAEFSVDEITALGDGVEETCTALAGQFTQVRVVTSHEPNRVRIEWRGDGDPPSGEIADFMAAVFDEVNVEHAADGVRVAATIEGHRR